MLEHAADYLIVSEGDRPLGILTERDIPRLLDRHPTPHDIPLSQAMTTPLRSVPVETSVTGALEAMNRFRLRHMVVLDEGRIAGVISQRRLFEQLAMERLENALQGAQLERERLRLETHLKLALDIGGAGSWEYQHDIDRRTASDGLLRIIGCRPEQAPDSMAAWLDRVHPDDLARLDTARQRSAHDEVQSQVIEYRVRHEDGHWLWVEDRCCVTERHADSSPRLTVGVLNDITARHSDRQQIERQNRALRLMSGIAQVIVRQADERSMLMEICSLIVDVGGYHRAWVGEALPDAEKRIQPIAQSGGAENYVAGLQLSWGDQPSGQGPAGRTVRSGVPYIVHDIESDPSFAPWRDIARADGYRSLIALPLRMGGKVSGLLMLYGTRANALDDDEVTLLSNLAGEVALGVNMLRSRQTLADNEAMLLEAQRLARIGHFTFDAASDTLSGSPTHNEILGVPVGELMNTQTWLALGATPTIACARLPIRATMSSVAASPSTTSTASSAAMTAKCAGFVPVGQLDIGPDGRVSRLFGTSQDITERKQFEQKLSQSTAALKEAQAIAHLGSWTAGHWHRQAGMERRGLSHLPAPARRLAQGGRFRGLHPPRRPRARHGRLAGRLGRQALRQRTPYPGWQCRALGYASGQTSISTKPGKPFPPSVPCMTSPSAAAPRSSCANCRWLSSKARTASSLPTPYRKSSTSMRPLSATRAIRCKKPSARTQAS